MNGLWAGFTSQKLQRSRVIVFLKSKIIARAIFHLFKGMTLTGIDVNTKVRPVSPDFFVCHQNANICAPPGVGTQRTV